MTTQFTTVVTLIQSESQTPEFYLRSQFHRQPPETAWTQIRAGNLKTSCPFSAIQKHCTGHKEGSKSLAKYRNNVLFQVVYFAATFPYVILLTLMVTGLLQEGAMNGVLYFITPDFDKLRSIEVSCTVLSGGRSIRRSVSN